MFHRSNAMSEQHTPTRTGIDVHGHGRRHTQGLAEEVVEADSLAETFDGGVELCLSAG